MAMYNPLHTQNEQEKKKKKNLLSQIPLIIFFVHIIIIIMKNSSIYIKIIIFVLKILTIEIIDNILWFNFNISYVKLFYQTSNRQ
ncbi:hypothetical protein PFFVO_05495 [Plasmodium falciparum Vietnam Oak-Knoll (FVO)]|uniref:Transmembrane protein n=1 Tax=Plasmodium falciparum Vietnam Oak-Knoll (FVO) TaxID=1036723 RepID=A0A024UXB5_PLAFA|nr:hypothetical protein PFFVO_05495 [Plasmodium falciparum Vietnam Oak-Knoll (FVO)]